MQWILYKNIKMTSKIGDAQIELNETLFKIEANIRLKLDLAINKSRADLQEFVKIDHLSTELCKLRPLEKGVLQSSKHPRSYQEYHNQVKKSIC